MMQEDSPTIIHAGRMINRPDNEEWVLIWRPGRHLLKIPSQREDTIPQDFSKSSQKQTFAWYDNYKSHVTCTECGETDPILIEFHHMDPTKKEGQISVFARATSITKLIIELEKCMPLCANCHIRAHMRKK